MKRRYLLIILSVILLFAACSTPENVYPSMQNDIGITGTPNDTETPSADIIYATIVHMFDNEEDLAEKLKSNPNEGYKFEHYYRPVNVPEFLKFKHIELGDYTLDFVYATALEDVNTEISFGWFFSQPDGDLCLKSLIERNGYIYVYPDNPAEGVKYASYMNRDEAGLLAWSVNYSVNGVCFCASIPWNVSDADVIKYLEMEKVELK